MAGQRKMEEIDHGDQGSTKNPPIAAADNTGRHTRVFGTQMDNDGRRYRLDITI